MWLVAAFFQLSVKSPYLFRAKGRTQESMKTVNIILPGVNFLEMLHFICCCIAYLSSFIRSLLILSFLLQLLLLLISLCHCHFCYLQSHFRPFIKTISNTDPWGTQKLYFGHLEAWFTNLCLGFAWCNCHIAQAGTQVHCLLPDHISQELSNQRDRWGPEVCPATCITSYLPWPWVRAMRHTEEAQMRPDRFWPGQSQSWGDSVGFALELSGSYY